MSATWPTWTDRKKKKKRGADCRRNEAHKETAEAGCELAGGASYQTGVQGVLVRQGPLRVLTVERKRVCLWVRAGL